MKARSVTTLILGSLVLLALFVPDRVATTAAQPQTATTATTTQRLQYLKTVEQSASVVVIQDNFAFVGVGSHLDIWNTTDPVNPSLYRQSGDLPGGVTAIAVQGNTVYVGGFSSITILNRDNPASPIKTLTQPAKVFNLAVANNCLYAAEGTAGLHIINVSNPAAPSEENPYASPFAIGLAVIDNYVYVSMEDSGLRILNVIDPSNPVEVGSIFPTGDTPTSVVLVGNYAYIGTASAFLVADITDRTSPKQVGGPIGTSIMSIAVQNNYAFVAYDDTGVGTVGVGVIDVSNPTAPKQVDFYPTTQEIFSVAATGIYVYVADGSDGLVILRLNITHPKNVIVFVQGACTSLDDGTGHGSGTFNDLQDLLRKSYGYRDADFLMYSYKGGFVDDSGFWHHNAYSNLDPIQQDFRNNGLNALHDQLLIPYHAKHPDTTFVLVGHSLGGVVAFEEIVQKVTSPDYQSGLISKVITVDTPLHGVTPTTFLAGVLPRSLDCLSQGIAADILVGRYNNEPNTTNTLIQKAREAKKAGAALVTMGNTYDCVWEAARCGWPLDIGYSDTQWIFDPDVQTSAFSIPQPCLKLKRECFLGTHSAVLDRKTGLSALQAVATYIGKQTYSISGQVVDAHKVPLSGVSISTSMGLLATTDKDGHYTIPGLLAGIYTLNASKRGYIFSPTAPTVNLLSMRRDVTSQNFVGKLDDSIFAPFDNGISWTVLNGYYDNVLQTEAGCNIGMNAFDHCRHQLFALDIVPDPQFANDKRVLAPMNGIVSYKSTSLGGCIGLTTLSDNLNVNVCHFASVNVNVGDRVERGKVLGTRSSSWVHLSLDDRKNTRSLCPPNPSDPKRATPPCYLPVPFMGVHALDGKQLNTNHELTGTVVDLGLVYPLCATRKKVNCTFTVQVQEWKGISGTSSNIAIP